MPLATAPLPTDPDELRAFALACQSELRVAELSVQVKGNCSPHPVEDAPGLPG